MCPFHGGRFEVTGMMLDEDVPCPECGELLKLNPFVVTPDSRAAGRTPAAVETEPELRYWLARPGSQPKGPYRASTVRQAYHDGKLPGDVLVCEHGAKEWMTLAEAGLAWGKRSGDASVASGPPPPRRQADCDVPVPR